MPKSSHKLKIVHLYPDILNLYGDIGNIITLKKRSEWRGIKVIVKDVSYGDDISTDGDIYFLGGGQDRDEDEIFKVLIKQKKNLKTALDRGAVFLTLCAGYQLMGKSYINAEGKTIKCLGFIDIETRSPGKGVKERCIGNIVTRLNPDIFDTNDLPFDTLVGFENHTGQTYLGEDVKPLSKVIKGKGNNVKDNDEGAVGGNIYGCYLHGLLYKNPHFADHLILKALKNKYGNKVRLKKLQDDLEILTHEALVQRFS